MKISYTLDENDYLNHQLFIASKSERIKKKRQRNKIIIPIFYLPFCLMFVLNKQYIWALFFIIAPILWFFIYPIRERKRYINHYSAFIKEHWNERFGKLSTVEFNNEYIIATDNNSESKVATIGIKEIYELQSYIYINLKDGQSLIIPKEKIENKNVLIGRLKELADFLKIGYIIDENWVWK